MPEAPRISAPLTHSPVIPEIAPSVLAADASQLGAECQRLEETGVQRIHWDVMDGVFVPNLTFGPSVVAACRPYTDLRFEAHLMMINPDKFITEYIQAGCDTILIHAETCVHLHKSLTSIVEAGARPGVVLNPHTPASSVSEVMGLVDQILVMTVNPGFGGSSYIDSVTSKIATLKNMIKKSHRNIELEVDGGINVHTAARATNAGADILVAGSAVFRHPDGPHSAITQLRDAAIGRTHANI